MINLRLLLICLLCVHGMIAQEKATPVAMTANNWEIPKDAYFETFENRETLVLQQGRARVKQLNFKNGTIQVDVYANPKRSFAGINFREKNDNMEEVYMRMHKSNQVDAIQYTPVFNNESNWQLYREYQAKIPFKKKGWNTLRLDVQDQSTKVYINGEMVLSVDMLKTDENEGGLGLWALFGNRFSNFRVTHAEVGAMAETNPSAIKNPSIITNWDLSQAVLYEEGKLDFADFSKGTYTEVTTEETGLLPISKYAKKSTSGSFEQNKEDYVVAKTTIDAQEAETRLFSFDYSDKIIVYLNGQPLFKGNNAFRHKGPQHTGHLAITTNKLYLPLKKGTNQLHCVVIDKANGWGLMGKLE